MELSVNEWVRIQIFSKDSTRLAWNRWTGKILFWAWCTPFAVWEATWFYWWAFVFERWCLWHIHIHVTPSQGDIDKWANVIHQRKQHASSHPPITCQPHTSSSRLLTLEESGEQQPHEYQSTLPHKMGMLEFGHVQGCHGRVPDDPGAENCGKFV